jgi:hypothetical protein
MTELMKVERLSLWVKPQPRLTSRVKPFRSFPIQTLSSMSVVVNVVTVSGNSGNLTSLITEMAEVLADVGDRMTQLMSVPRTYP